MGSYPRVGRRPYALFASVVMIAVARSVWATGGVSSDNDTSISEIVVTAEKRSERLQDVPIPVTAVNAADLVSTNQVRLQDYFTQIPGLIVTPNGSLQSLAIRGITTDGGNPTVGVTVDDVPFGSSTNLRRKRSTRY